MNPKSHLPRYTRRPLPPYSYVPGKNNHPISHPDGHSHGHEPSLVNEFSLEHWDSCEDYLRGIDLFNHGFHWEAHENWEAVWNAAGRKGRAADFLKGLIKLAATAVKQAEGRPVGVVRHAQRAHELFLGCLSNDDAAVLCGIELQRLAAYAKEIAKEEIFRQWILVLDGIEKLP